MSLDIENVAHATDNRFGQYTRLSQHVILFRLQFRFIVLCDGQASLADNIARVRLFSWDRVE